MKRLAAVLSVAVVMAVVNMATAQTASTKPALKFTKAKEPVKLVGLGDVTRNKVIVIIRCKGGLLDREGLFGALQLPEGAEPAQLQEELQGMLVDSHLADYVNGARWWGHVGVATTPGPLPDFLPSPESGQPRASGGRSMGVGRPTFTPAAPDAFERTTSGDLQAHSIYLLATDEAKAKELAEAMVSIYNARVAIERQQMQSELAKVEQEMAAANKKAEPIRKQIADTTQLLAKDPVTAQMSEQMANQAWQFRVAKTGLKGKLDAINRLARQKDLSAAARNKLEELKIEAEIEIAGLEHSEMELENFRTMYREREAMTKAVEDRNRELVPLDATARDAKNRVENMKVELKTLLGDLEVKDATIRPVSWEKPAPRETSPMRVPARRPMGGGMPMPRTVEPAQ